MCDKLFSTQMPLLLLLVLHDRQTVLLHVTTNVLQNEIAESSSKVIDMYHGDERRKHPRYKHAK